MAKIYSLKAGAKVPDYIVAIATEEKILTARVEAIGGVKPPGRWPFLLLRRLHGARH